MIGAMPAVAVRHERKRQEKRLKRPSQLYLGGQWMPPPQGSPPTPSPHGHNSHLEPLPELYLCGKISGLHAVVVCLLLGAVVLVVGLVQLAPGATTTDHRLALLVAGTILLLLVANEIRQNVKAIRRSSFEKKFSRLQRLYCLVILLRAFHSGNVPVLKITKFSGIILAGVRCYVLHCVPLPNDSPVATPLPPPTTEQSGLPRGTLDLLVGHQNQPETDALMHTEQHHQQYHHHHHHHHGNHKKKRSSQGSHSDEA
ncbi:hypothetical protein ANTRET_LOCUS10867 [Anthophora retusa]